MEKIIEAQTNHGELKSLSRYTQYYEKKKRKKTLLLSNILYPENIKIG